MKHTVQIILLGQYTSPKFNYFSNGDMDLFFELLIFEWQHKSGRECAMFVDENLRSFANNDFVIVDDKIYQNTIWGMLETTHEILNEITDKIKSHPQYSQNPFWAKLEVMNEYDKNSMEFCPR